MNAANIEAMINIFFNDLILPQAYNNPLPKTSTIIYTILLSP